MTDKTVSVTADNGVDLIVSRSLLAVDTDSGTVHHRLSGVDTLALTAALTSHAPVIGQEDYWLWYSDLDGTFLGRGPGGPMLEAAPKKGSRGWISNRRRGAWRPICQMVLRPCHRAPAWCTDDRAWVICTPRAEQAMARRISAGAAAWLAIEPGRALPDHYDDAEATVLGDLVAVGDGVATPNRSVTVPTSRGWIRTGLGGMVLGGDHTPVSAVLSGWRRDALIAALTRRDPVNPNQVSRGAVYRVKGPAWDPEGWIVQRTADGWESENPASQRMSTEPYPGSLLTELVPIPGTRAVHPEEVWVDARISAGPAGVRRELPAPGGTVRMGPLLSADLAGLMS